MSMAVYKYLWRVVIALFQKPNSTTPLLRRQVQAFYSVPATLQPISATRPPILFSNHTEAKWPGPTPRLCWHAWHTGGWQSGLLSSFFFSLSVMLPWPWLSAMSTFTPSCAPAAVYFSLLAPELSSELSEGQHYEVILEIMGMFFRLTWALNTWWSVGSHIQSCQERSISYCWSVVDKCIDFRILDCGITIKTTDCLKEMCNSIFTLLIA